eukprot:CAMPEP_0172498702 /NCGR_PEP_ID=MMETSP1066-20121228/116153_1 /TAXON_ID=671091 /ORGANISM="Coscinodiscus wailesii, Strain CCMP2513" /LENGTH=174 /DNA_ID=CAMNT_0013272091 /DNA_START=255 /DNA_END=779 /DNA_ORIENTATION=+
MAGFLFWRSRTYDKETKQIFSVAETVLEAPPPPVTTTTTKTTPENTFIDYYDVEFYSTKNNESKSVLYGRTSLKKVLFEVVLLEIGAAIIFRVGGASTVKRAVSIVGMVLNKLGVTRRVPGFFYRYKALFEAIRVSLRGVKETAIKLYKRRGRFSCFGDFMNYVEPTEKNEGSE